MGTSAVHADDIRSQLREESREQAAVLVSSSVLAVRKCVECPFAIVWDQVLRTFLQRVRNTDEGKELLKKRAHDKDYLKDRSDRQRRTRQLRAKRQATAKKKLPSHLRNIMAQSSSDEDSTSSEEEEVEDVSSDEASDEEGSGSSRAKKEKPTARGNKKSNKKPKVTLAQKLDPIANPGRKLKTEDLRYLAKEIPLLYHCDDSFTLLEQKLIKNAFADEGMNFKPTKNREAAFLLFRPLQDLVTVGQDGGGEEKKRSSVSSVDETGFSGQSPKKIRKIDSSPKIADETGVVQHLHHFVGSSSLTSKAGAAVRIFGNDV